MKDSDDTKEPSARRQTFFRCTVGFAAIAILAAESWQSGIITPASAAGAALVALFYVLLAVILLWGFANDATALARVGRYLTYADTVLIGAFIALLNFSVLPLVMFATIVQCNALASGGIHRWLKDNIALIAGAVAVAAFRHPTAEIRLDQLVNVITLTAFALYFSIYGFLSFTRNSALHRRLSELEGHQVRLKLHNYSLSKYLSPTLREAIVSGRDVRLESQRKQLTIFFSDIKGFGELAEEMDADALTALLNSYLTEMSGIALEHGATIDKFIGDAMMIFFGDPVSRGPKMDSVACVAMAIDMKKRMRELQLHWLNQGIKPLEIRMGINTGYCTVGNFGTENRLDYTALGTEVNLASRLESAAKPGEILITHATYMLIKDVIMCRDRGEITVKGFQYPIRVYSVVDLRKNLGKDQHYFEYASDGFAVYMDLDKIRNYDREKALKALENAHRHLKTRSPSSLSELDHPTAP